MEKGIIDFALELMTAIGTFCTGIAALIGIFKLAKNALYRNEILYGDEAAERFRKIEPTLPKSARLIGEYPFAGGAATIIPQLKVMRLRYNQKSMPIEYKGCTQTLRYIAHDEKTAKTIEKVWVLK
jgi:hypothetical protein